jgi:NADH-quinone oxidoreductase subunit M
MNVTILIPLLLLVPLLMGGAVVLLLPPENQRGIRIYSLLVTLLTLGLGVAVACLYHWSDSANLQLPAGHTWISEFGFSIGLGITDAVSLWLVLLTVFLMPLVVFGSFSAVKERTREFYFWLLVLEAAMLGVFLATDILFFYICFEFTLVPLYFLIGIFGSTQRLKAARVFFLYTFSGSMLTLAGVLYVAYIHATQNAGVWSFDIRELTATARAMSAQQQMWVFFALLAGFAVKVPLFPVHTWLPLAHTEAPTAGSVVLAGVLLKLGTYGLIRLAIPMTPLAAARFAPLIAVLAIIGILYTALICWVQKDLKKLIAYSSVSHLGFCVLGLFALNVIGGQGSVMYMVNHGLSTGALFLCVGMVYERFHTREMAQMSGLARVMPVWAFFLVFFSLASVGLPGFNGFVGEFLCLLGAFDYHGGALGPAYGVVAAIGMIFGAIYILYMVGKVLFGQLKVPDVEGHGSGHVSDLNLREVLTLAPLAVACLVIGLYPKPILQSLEAPVAQLTAPANAAAHEIAMGSAAQTGATGRPSSGDQCSDARSREPAVGLAAFVRIPPVGATAALKAVRGIAP